MLQTKQQRQLLVTGIVTILVAAITLINYFLDNETSQSWVSIIGMLLVAASFLWAYLMKHETWAIIGIYVGVAIAFFIFFVTQIGNNGGNFLNAGEDVWVPSMALILVALPFFWTWLVDRSRWAFLIPAYILLAIIPILLMGNDESAQEYLVPAYVMFAIGLPFLIGYLNMPEWQLLVPGGILMLAALLFLGLNYGLQTTFLTIGVPVVAILVGLFLLWRAMNNDEMQQEQ